ncbi:hypothetical protein GCM10017744_012210 [Streptomyces antimycoticus]
MPEEEFRPVYHPAGYDGGLRIALQDLRTGRWISMRNLLAETPTWALWTQRTQVLATAAAGSTVVDAWRAEEPQSVAALVMGARVGVERAVRAHREGHRRTGSCGGRRGSPASWPRTTPRRIRCPGCVCWPWRSWTRSSGRRSTGAPARSAAVPGPWGLLAEADRRDPYNREAYHRMLQFVYARRAGGSLAEAVNFAQWVSSSAPGQSALQVLPLYVHVERYREERGYEKALDLHWATEDATRDAQKALHGWFDHADLATSSLLDLNHLAHALWGALRFSDAAASSRRWDRTSPRSPGPTAPPTRRPRRR